RLRLVGARAQDHGQLNGKEHSAAQVAVQGIETAGTILQQDGRRRGLAGAVTFRAEVFPGLRIAPAVSEPLFPDVCYACRIRIDSTTQRIDGGWKRRLKVSINTLAEILLIHHHRLGEERVILKQVRNGLAGGRIQKFGKQYAALSAECL